MNINEKPYKRSQSINFPPPARPGLERWGYRWWLLGASIFMLVSGIWLRFLG